MKIYRLKNIKTNRLLPGKYMSEEDAKLAAKRRSILIQGTKVEIVEVETEEKKK